MLAVKILGVLDWGQEKVEVYLDRLKYHPDGRDTITDEHRVCT